MKQGDRAEATGPSGGVLIVDFGAQYCQLIARRVRELGVYSRITVPERAMFTFAAMRPAAVILSGGPRSVYERDAPALDAAILQQGVPVLGICYGLQWLAFGIMAPLGLGYVVWAELRERRKEKAQTAEVPDPETPPAPRTTEEKLADRYGRSR